MRSELLREFANELSQPLPLQNPTTINKNKSAAGQILSWRNKSIEGFGGVVRAGRERNKDKAKLKRKKNRGDWKRRLTISSQEICFICQARSPTKIRD